jgi:hypothetical protein
MARVGVGLESNPQASQVVIVIAHCNALINIKVVIKTHSKTPKRILVMALPLVFKAY